MPNAVLAIQSFMTRSPHSIGVEQTLERAHEMMRAHAIRHLPVLSGGRLVGILTERDLALVETFHDVDPSEVLVEDAMSTAVYVVSPDVPLDEVVNTMADHKYGSAVVMQNRSVVGIFTTVDACRALADVLRTPRTSVGAVKSA